MPTARPMLRASARQAMKQVTNWKQRESQNGAAEIEVMTKAVLPPPMHRGRPLQCFGDMRENDQHHTACTNQL